MQTIVGGLNRTTKTTSDKYEQSEENSDEDHVGTHDTSNLNRQQWFIQFCRCRPVALDRLLGPDWVDMYD